MISTQPGRPGAVITFCGAPSFMALMRYSELRLDSAPSSITAVTVRLKVLSLAMPVSRIKFVSVVPIRRTSPAVLI